MENNSKEQNDKTLDVLIARTNTRETSTLTIVTVAASASLILLGLYSQSSLQPSWIIVVLGMAFPILSLIYRTITYYTIQKDDYEEIRNRIPAKDHQIIKNEKRKRGKNNSLLLNCGIANSGMVISFSGILKTMND